MEDNLVNIALGNASDISISGPLPCGYTLSVHGKPFLTSISDFCIVNETFPPAPAE